MNDAPSYLDVTDETFENEVLNRSKQMPVVVDLWAPWCGPCRDLGPLIEAAVAATEGRVVLTKVNVDENPAVSQAFSVQSIPAVYALSDGQVVDHFIGALPKDKVEAFVQGLLPSEAETEVQRLVKAGDEESLRRALELEPDNHDAIVDLGELLIADDKADEALELLRRIPETAETRRVAALARTGVLAEDVDVASKLDALLDQVKDDEAARQSYVDLLELLGADDPRTAVYRKKLTSRLF